MAFTASSSSGSSAEINVTPLIDVLLVLLIIFMVLAPGMPHGLEALVPQPPKTKAAQPQPEQPIVVQVSAAHGGGVRYEVNHQPFERSALAAELARVMDTREDKAMFVRGDRDLQFSDVADVVGMGHAANASRIGILTPQGDRSREQGIGKSGQGVEGRS